MKKLILFTVTAFSMTGCYEVGPPNYNERDRRAYNSLLEVKQDHGPYCDSDPYYCHNVYYHDHYYRNDGNDGHYDANHVWHYYEDDHDADYNPHDGHDHWARQSN